MKRALILFVMLACAASILRAADRGERIVSRMPRTTVESSALCSVGYSWRFHTLEIEFHNGAIYRYFDVPGDVYKRLMSAESKATFYDDNIRGHFRSAHVQRPRGL